MFVEDASDAVAALRLRSWMFRRTSSLFCTLGLMEFLFQDRNAIYHETSAMQFLQQRLWRTIVHDWWMFITTVLPMVLPRRSTTGALSTVFRRLHFSLSKEDIEAVASCEPQMIERILKLLKYKIAKYRPNGLNGDSDHMKESTEGGHFHDSLHNHRTRHHNPQREMLIRVGHQSQMKDNGTRQDFLHEQECMKRTNIPLHMRGGSQEQYSPSRTTSPRRGSNMQELSSMNAKLEEKDSHIRELGETIELLEAKVRKLEQLLRLKEHKIQVLSGKVPKQNGRS